MTVPHDLGAERDVLGCLITKPDLIGEALDRGLDVDDFYRPVHRAAWQAIVDLDAGGKPVDPLTVAAQVDGLDDAEAALWYPLAGASTHVAVYIDTLKEVAGKRRDFAEGHRLIRESSPAGDDLGAGGAEVEPSVDAGALADGHRPTDVGNADRLYASADGQIRYVQAWRKWLVYGAGVWRIDTADTLISEKAKDVARQLFRRAADLTGHDRDEMWKWAKRSEAAPAIANMVRLARGMPGILIDHRELDSHPWLLNVLNGTLDLRTGELLRHDPEHLLTKQAPVIYDPAATAPLWEQCLRQWQPDPATRGYLQRLIGSAATGHPVEEVSINYGTGGNGKGKFYGTVAGVLGPDFVVVPHKSLLVAQRHDQHDTVKARLFGARLAVAAESDAGDRLDEARVKELTGGDLLEARRMNEDPWQFAPSHTLILHTNYRPRIRGGDDGIWRRVRLVPWAVTIPAEEQDAHLADRLAAEAPGILNWIMAGCAAWQVEGLNPPPEVAAATASYRSEEDHVGRFLADSCTIGPDRMVAAADLRDSYEKWCAEVGESPWTAKSVGAQLTAKGFDSTQVGKSRSRTWVGLDLAGGERL